MLEFDITVTNTATLVTSLTGGSKIPQNSSYVVIMNPNASASIAFSINGATPVINGLGITLGSLGSQTYDSPPGIGFPVGSLTMISSVSSQAVTILVG